MTIAKGMVRSGIFSHHFLNRWPD